MNLKQAIKTWGKIDILIDIYRFFRNIYFKYQERYILYKYDKNKESIASEVSKKKIINVVFYAMNVSMWRYQGLYELMLIHPRFNPMIVLSPSSLYNKKLRMSELNKMRHYFTQKCVKYYDFFDNNQIIDVKNKLKPDILFYPQPYRNTLVSQHDFLNFKDKLLCYCPYAFWTSNEKWGYDTLFHNMAWMLFYSTEIHKRNAEKWSRNKGNNVYVVGYPNADEFLKDRHIDRWKKQETKKIRLIWAPHCTIETRKKDTSHSNFLRMADMMLNYAKENSEILQIAFKPHPRLKTELYNYKTWGKEKTDLYYEEWRKMENGQLEDGEFIDLFMTSDAMIHDSSSFSVEYHYSHKPVMFVTQDVNKYKCILCDFGNKALGIHYIGYTLEDIRKFLDDIVICGKDKKYNDRLEFFRKYLLPPNGKTVTQNMFDSITKNLKI